MYVYGDVILAINVIANVIILGLTGWLTGTPTTWWRIAAGAVAGALYALALAFPQPQLWHGLGFKLLLSAVLLVIVFGRLRLRAFIKLWLVFLLISFVLGVMVVARVLVVPPRVWTAGPALAIPQPSLAILLGGISLGAVLLMATWRFLQLRLQRLSLRYRLVLGCGGREATVSAILDTGNALQTVMRRQPIVVVAYAAIRPLLDGSMRTYLDQHQPGDWALQIDNLTENKWLSRLEVIPYRTVGLKQGLLLGLRMDYIAVYAANQRPVRVSPGSVALYDGALAGLADADALLPAAFLRVLDQVNDLSEEAKSCVSNGQ